MKMEMAKKSFLCLLMMTFPLTGLVGCASKYGTQTTKVERYPQCYAPIQQLRDDENRVAKDTAAGAAGGALLGALIGGLATGKVEGAVAGGMAGGLAGGSLAYATSKQNQIKDQNARMASYMKDLDGDIAGLDAATASARASTQCYDKEFKMLVARYKSGNITRIELDKGYQEIKNGLSEADRILGVTLQKAYDREAQYDAALSDEAQKMGIPTQSASTKKRSLRSSSPLKQVQTKKVAFSGNIKELASAKQDGQASIMEKQRLMDDLAKLNV
ncbi:MAG: hypothetical protein LBN28_03010 [Desulfovibrio sp.]|nr:hypothetical protein [Desulfovibrio sp.]